MKKILINGNNYTSSYFLDFPEKYDVVSKINIHSDFTELSEKYSCIINFYEVLKGEFLDIYHENFLYVKELSEICTKHNIKFIQISTCDFYHRSHDWKNNVENSDKLNLSNDYLISKRVCEKFLENENHLIVRIKSCFDSRFHPDNWLVQAYNFNKISNMVDTHTYIPDLKKVLEFLLENNKKGIYNMVQQESGSDLYFLSSLLSTKKFSHLDPHFKEHEEFLTFANDENLKCSDVNITKLLQEYPNLTNLKAAVLICWEHLKSKVDNIEV